MFKVGDKVRCIRGTFVEGPLENGDYTVTAVKPYGWGPYTILSLAGVRNPPIGGWLADRFKLITNKHDNEDDLYV